MATPVINGTFWRRAQEVSLSFRIPDLVHDRGWRKLDQQLPTNVAPQCPQDTLEVVGEAQKNEGCARHEVSKMRLWKTAIVVASDLVTQKVAHQVRLRVMFNRPHVKRFEARRNEWKTEPVQTILHRQIGLFPLGQVQWTAGFSQPHDPCGICRPLFPSQKRDIFVA